MDDGSITGVFDAPRPPEPVVDDTGIWVPHGMFLRLVMTKEMFIEAYRLYIEGRADNG